MTEIKADIYTYSDYNTITLNNVGIEAVSPTDVITYSINNIGPEKNVNVLLKTNPIENPYMLYVPKDSSITFKDVGNFNIDNGNIINDTIITPTANIIYTYELNSNVTITITPTPADSIVKIMADGYTQVGNSITVPVGTEVSYIIEGNGEHLYAWTSEDDTNVSIFTKTPTLNTSDEVYSVIFDKNGNTISYEAGLDINTSSGTYWLDIYDSVFQATSDTQLNIYGYIEK